MASYTGSRNSKVQKSVEMRVKEYIKGHQCDCYRNQGKRDVKKLDMLAKIM